MMTTMMMMMMMMTMMMMMMIDVPFNDSGLVASSKDESSHAQDVTDHFRVTVGLLVRDVDGDEVGLGCPV